MPDRKGQRTKVSNQVDDITMPFESEAQRRAMYAAASGHSTLGIPEDVGEKFVKHKNDDTGLSDGAILPDITELDIMRRIRDGQMDSPQQFGDVWLFALRVTGTGYAKRASGEIGYKSPADYLTDEFLTRCQGLPVVWEHPEELLLDSESFRNQVIGASALPYIFNDEVWTIARIYDIHAAKLMRDNQLSTSPAVSISNSAIKIGDILLEGNPVYIDHIAVCERGVWDKGGSPTGVRTDSTIQNEEDLLMETEEKSGGDDLLSTLKNLLQEHTTRIDAKFDEVHNRLDELSAKPEEKEPEMKADDDLDPEEKEEVKEEIEEVKHVVDDSECKADDDDDSSIKADSLKIAALEREIRKLQAATKPASISDREAIAKAISRADSVMMALGETNAVTHVPGESAFSFRKRMAAKLAQYSSKFKNTSVGDIRDERLFSPVEDMIYADAMEYSKAPPITPGTVHMIEKKGPYGMVIIEPTPNSDPHGWMDMFANGAIHTGTINKH